MKASPTRTAGGWLIVLAVARFCQRGVRSHLWFSERRPTGNVCHTTSVGRSGLVACNCIRPVGALISAHGEEINSGRDGFHSVPRIFSAEQSRGRFDPESRRKHCFLANRLKPDLGGRRRRARPPKTFRPFGPPVNHQKFEFVKRFSLGPFRTQITTTRRSMQDGRNCPETHKWWKAP